MVSIAGPMPMPMDVTYTYTYDDATPRTRC